MLGQRFGYSGERQRHEKLVGRAQLLARLDQLLVDGDGDPLGRGDRRSGHGQERDPRGHTDRVTACAVTLDGLRVVAASEDRTLKVWELAPGCALATLEGHTDWVNACAVTPDGWHVVSTSSDQTLKVWDLETHACLMTHRGDAPYLAVAATATVIVAGESQAASGFSTYRNRFAVSGDPAFIRACLASPHRT